jgi:hypothetical protein
MATTPVQRGTAFLYKAAPTAAAFVVDADTYSQIVTQYQDQQTIKDNNAEDACEVGQNPAQFLEFEATVKSGQTAPAHLDLVTMTFPDASTVEFVVIDPVPVTGFGKVQRIKLKLKKASLLDYSP